MNVVVNLMFSLLRGMEQWFKKCILCYIRVLFFFFFFWPCHRAEGLRLRSWPRCLNARRLYFVRQVQVSVIGMLITYKYFLWNLFYTQDVFFVSLWSLMPSCTFPVYPNRFFLCILAVPFDNSNHEFGIYYGQ